MTKIYQLITSVQLGGAEIVAFNLAEYCGNDPQDNFEFSILELFNTKNAYAKAKKADLTAKNIRVRTLHKGSKRSGLLFAPFKLVYYIWKEKPSIIHSHTDLPDFVLSVALRVLKIIQLKPPMIIRTIHNTQLWRTHFRLGRFTESAFSNEHIVSVSNFALKAYEQLRIKNNLSISEQRQVIYNGRELPQKQPHPFKINKEKINVAFCGRFEEYKGMDILIPAIPEISRLFPDTFIFHIIGDGTYKKQLLQLSMERNNVFLYNPVPNISNMFYAFDYIFMPSHFEGLALISIEASLSKVPVIASFAPGLDETLPEDWPLKFHLDHKDKLYSIFKNIKESNYDVELLKEQLYSYATKMFSLHSMISAYSKIYKNE